MFFIKCIHIGAFDIGMSNKQSAEAILQEQIVSKSKIIGIMAAYEAGTFVDGGIIQKALKQYG